MIGSVKREMKSLLNFSARSVAPRKPSANTWMISPVIAFASLPEKTSKISARATAKSPESLAISVVTSKSEIILFLM